MENPYQPPVTASLDRRRPLRELYWIAVAQKAALFSLVAYVLVMVIIWNWITRAGIVLVYLLLLVVIANIVSLSVLAARVYSSTALLVLGLLMVVPLLGMIALIAVNQKANRVFEESGYPAGIFGPRVSDLR